MLITLQNKITVLIVEATWTCLTIIYIVHSNCHCFHWSQVECEPTTTGLSIIVRYWGSPPSRLTAQVLVWCWASVTDVGPALNQHCVTELILPSNRRASLVWHSWVTQCHMQQASTSQPDNHCVRSYGVRSYHSKHLRPRGSEWYHILNRQSPSEWGCVGHVDRPSVYTVDLHVDCIQLSSYNLIIRLWILPQRDTHPTLF